MFMCGNLGFSVISSSLLGSYTIHGKSKSYKEHGYKLTVNKLSCHLELPYVSFQGAMLRDNRFKIQNETEMRTAIELSLYLRKGEISSVVKAGAEVELTLLGGVSVLAVDSLDGPVWIIGHSSISLSKCPTPSSIKAYLNHPEDKRLNQLYLDKLMEMGVMQEVSFTETSLNGRKFNFSYHLLSGDFFVREEGDYLQTNCEFFGLFHVGTFIEATRLAELFRFETWEKIMEKYVVRGDYGYEKLRVAYRVTNSFDLTLSLSPDPNERGFWLSPSMHSVYGYDSEKEPVERKPVRLGLLALNEAITAAKQELSHPSKPEFRTLTWNIIKGLATVERTWTLTEHDVTLTWNGDFLTAQFFGLNDYPDSITLSKTDDFDRELIEEWCRYSGELPHNLYVVNKA